MEGDVSLGMNFEVSKDSHAIPGILSASCLKFRV